MNEKDRNILDKALSELLDFLEPNNITPYLRAEELISKEDYEELGTKELYPTAPKRVIKLVEILKQKLETLSLLTPILEETHNIPVLKILQLQPSSFSSHSVHATDSQLELVSELRGFYQEFSRTRFIPWDPKSIVELNEVFVNLEMQDGLRRSSQENYDMCLNFAKRSRIPIIVQGEPGGGKTTLVKKICLDWANGLLPQFKFVLMARLRDVPEAEDFFDICMKWMTHCCPFLRESSSQKYYNTIMSAEPREILLLLDGLDEVITVCPQLNNELYQNDFVELKYPTIFTTRPYKVNDILCDHQICYIQRLKFNQQIELATNYFDAQNTDPESRQKFFSVLRSNKDLQNSLKTPLLLQLSLLCDYSTEGYRQTDLYENLILSLISAYNENHPNARFDLPDSWLSSEAVFRLGRLAFDKLIEGEEGVLNFAEETLQSYKVDPIFVKVGILTVEPRWCKTKHGKPKIVYSFLHKTMQEFFAAAALTVSFQKFQKVMADEANRLTTFRTLPITWDFNPEVVAKAGFFFSEMDQKVMCAFCHKRIPLSDSIQIHEGHFSECPFFQLESKLNKKGDRKSSEHRAEYFVTGSSCSGHGLYDLVQASLYMHFSTICASSSNESWKQIGLQQTFFFLIDLMSNVGMTKWVEMTIGYSYFDYLSVFHHKILSESPAVDIDKIIEMCDELTGENVVWGVPLGKLESSKYFKQLHSEIFHYNRTEQDTSRIFCDFSATTLTTDIPAEIQHTISPFKDFSLSASEQQLKLFCHILPVNIEILRISINSNEENPNAHYPGEHKFPPFSCLTTLSLDISSSGWSEWCNELVQSAPTLSRLYILGNGELFDFCAFDITGCECLGKLLIGNIELNFSDRCIPSLKTKLQPLANLVLLKLSECKLTAGKLLSPLLRSLKIHNSKIQFLLLQWNKGLGKDTEGFTKCCKEFPEFPALHTLSLRGCGLSDCSVGAVEYLLLKSNSLKYLWLSQNRFESDEKVSKLKDAAKVQDINLYLG